MARCQCAVSTLRRRDVSPLHATVRHKRTPEPRAETRTVQHNRACQAPVRHRALTMRMLMAGRDLKHLADNFPDALVKILWGLGIPAAAIQRELEASREALIAKTNSRSHLGTLNDFADMLRWQLHGQEDLDLVQVAIGLARTPVRPLRPLGFPDKVTRQLLTG